MNALKAPFNFLIQEFHIFLAFSWRDWSATIIPGSLFSIGALRGSQLDPVSILSRYLFLVLWLTFYVYFFNLFNQITGIEEDRINKPDRPIPSGKVTLAGAQIRWVLVLMVFLGLGFSEPSILLETLCWISTAAFMCLTTAANHWFGKNNIALTSGTWALLGASWKAIAPATLQSERYVVAIALWVGLTFQIQDLRDIEGDAAVGRKTFPLVFGDRGSRLIITFFLLPLAVLVLWLGGIVQIAPPLVIAVHIFLGWRILQAKGSMYDHKTYMMHTYIFCLLSAMTFWKAPEETLHEIWKTVEVMGRPLPF